MDKKQFIQTIAPLAKQDYYQSYILPSITIAQAALESGWGRSYLTINGNNLFGIKGKPGGLYWTKEFVDGQYVDVQAWFRHYENWVDSIKDHSDLFRRGTKDNPDRYEWVIGQAVYTKAAIEIQRAGYATAPDYAEKLVILIEQHKLFTYDMEVLAVEEEVKQLRERVEILENGNKKISAPDWYDVEFPGVAKLIHEPMELVGWRASATVLRYLKARGSIL